MSNYEIHLVALRCVQAQEGDGDEIYLKVNNDTVFTWEKLGYKFSHNLNKKGATNMYDFRVDKVGLKDGHEAANAYTDTSVFVFKDLTEPTVIELWESDRDERFRGGDDELGAYQVDGGNKGESTLLFNLHNAEYELVLRISTSS